MDIGRYDDAELSLKEVIETYKKIEPATGRRHNQRSRKSYAEFYRGRGRYEEALHTYNELIDIQEKITDTQSDPEEHSSAGR